jgi:HAD superfamily hydrolase (TIGR01490 family)
MTLALFDFDGTLTTHETMPVFVRRSVGAFRLVLGQLVLAPLILGYKLRWVSGTRVRRAIVGLGYRGVPKAALAAAGEEFARTYLPSALRPEAMERLQWHRRQGHQVVVVSGGLDVYLAPWCRAHGLDFVCSSLESRDGLLTGRYLGRQCVLEEKVRRIREHCDLAAHDRVYAYGDTPEDIPLLGLATHAYFNGEAWPAGREALADDAPYKLSA